MGYRLKAHMHTTHGEQLQVAERSKSDSNVSKGKLLMPKCAEVLTL